jgi:hypothetical protein
VIDASAAPDAGDDLDDVGIMQEGPDLGKVGFPSE